MQKDKFLNSPDSSFYKLNLEFGNRTDSCQQYNADIKLRRINLLLLRNLILLKAIKFKDIVSIDDVDIDKLMRMRASYKGVKEFNLTGIQARSILNIREKLTTLDTEGMVLVIEWLKIALNFDTFINTLREKVESAYEKKSEEGG